MCVEDFFGLGCLWAHAVTTKTATTKNSVRIFCMLHNLITNPLQVERIHAPSHHLFELLVNVYPVRSRPGLAGHEFDRNIPMKLLRVDRGSRQELDFLSKKD
jgi:hypothetical protein